MDPKELEKKLGITSNTDLYTVAGCILRLIMWPTKKMWRLVNKEVQVSNNMDKLLVPSKNI